MVKTPEFLSLTVQADYGCFLWAIEPEAQDGGFVGVDFDVLEVEVPHELVHRFRNWHREWEEAQRFVCDPSAAKPDASAYERLDAEGGVLAAELAITLGQPVEYVTMCPRIQSP